MKAAATAMVAPARKDVAVGGASPVAPLVPVSSASASSSSVVDDVPVWVIRKVNV